MAGQRIYDSTQRINDPRARCSLRRTELSTFILVAVATTPEPLTRASPALCASLQSPPPLRQETTSCNISPISFSLFSHLLHSPCPSPLSAISLGHSLSGHTFSVWIVNLTAYHSICHIAVSGTRCLGAATLSQPWQTQLQHCRWRHTTSLLHQDGNLDYIAISSGGSWNACAYGIG